MVEGELNEMPLMRIHKKGEYTMRQSDFSQSHMREEVDNSANQVRKGQMAAKYRKRTTDIHNIIGDMYQIPPPDADWDLFIDWLNLNGKQWMSAVRLAKRIVVR